MNATRPQPGRDAARHRRTDLLLAGSLAATTMIAMATTDGLGGWWVAAAGMVVAVAVLIAQRRPDVAVACTAIPGLVMASTLWESPFALAVVVLSYLAGRRTQPDWRRAAPSLAAVSATGGVMVLAGQPDLATWLSMIASLLSVILFPGLLGHSRRQRRALADAGWERAQRLEREQHLISQQARSQERARITADMHDSLGHDLSLLTLRAAGLEVTPDLDERHREAVAQLRSDATHATQRLGTIIGIMRDDADPPPTTPSTETIEQLVTRSIAAGLTVTLDLDVDALPEPGSRNDRAAFRVIQEALTNASKHAPGAPITVKVTGTPQALRLSVTNQPPSTTSESPDVVSGGSGLIGLHERLLLVGGKLTANPTSEGGFEVEAMLPHTHRRIPTSVGRSTHTSPLGVASTTSDEHEQARRRARRSLAMTLALPTASAIVAAIGVIGYWTYEMSTTVLSSQAFDDVDVGASTQDLADRLPTRQVTWAARAPQPAIPDQATCHYYRSGWHPFIAEPIYRLCLTGDTLVAKDVLMPPSNATQ